MNALTFNNITLNPVDQNDNQIWLTSKELSAALGYKNSTSLNKLYNANKSEFTSSMTMTTESVVSAENKGLRAVSRIFSLRGCHAIAMFARTDVAKAFRIWVLDVLDNEVGAPTVQNEELPSSVKDRNGLVKAAKITQYKLGISYDDVFSLIHHRFNIDKLGDLTVSQVGEATEYIQRMRYPLLAEVHHDSKPALEIEPPYHYRNNERLVSKPDAAGNLWTRPLADHEFIASTRSLPQFINDCEDFDLQELTAISFSVSKKMVEAQAWSNVIMVNSDGEQS